MPEPMRVRVQQGDQQMSTVPKEGSPADFGVVAGGSKKPAHASRECLLRHGFRTCAGEREVCAHAGQIHMEAPELPMLFCRHVGMNRGKRQTDKCQYGPNKCQ